MKDKFTYAIVFGLLFATLSWVVPAAYYTTVPSETMVEVRQVDVDMNGTEHALDVTYRAQSDYTVKAEIVLFRVDTSEETDISVQKWAVEGFVDRGLNDVILNLQLNEPVQEGDYFYELRITYRPGYNTERTTVYQSDVISITNNSSTKATYAN